MRRETIEMSYFAKCDFCSEIIVAELMPATGRRLSTRMDRMNDNRFRVMSQEKPASRRRRVQPAA